MKSALSLIFGTLALVLLSFAQISPTPVINNEIKDNSSIRMRSIELERVKRDANKLLPPDSSNESGARFAQIKEDFEGIQKLEASIVKTYKTGVTIDYSKIHEDAREMKKKAMRLKLNFFNSDLEADSLKKKKTSQKSLKDLIIELDRVIGSFISSPAFKSIEVVDSKTLEKAELDLLKIIVLSDSLSAI
jgi:hypothetical protein